MASLLTGMRTISAVPDERQMSPFIANISHSLLVLDIPVLDAEPVLSGWRAPSVWILSP